MRTFLGSGMPLPLKKLMMKIMDEAMRFKPAAKTLMANSQAICRKSDKLVFIVVLRREIRNRTIRNRKNMVGTLCKSHVKENKTRID